MNAMKTRFLVLWAAAVLATAAAFVAHLSLRLETVRLGYEVSGARREERQLIETRRNLAVEAATLRQASRVEAFARKALDMDQPDPERVVPVGRQASAARRTAGWVR